MANPEVPISDDLTEIRRLSEHLLDAFSAVGSILDADSPEGVAAQKVLDRAQDEWLALTKHIFAKPVVSLTDVIERAEIARAEACDACRDDLSRFVEANSRHGDYWDTVCVQLIFAVLTLAEGGSHG